MKQEETETMWLDKFLDFLTKFHKGYHISFRRSCPVYCEKGKTMLIDIDFREPEFYLNIDLIRKWDPPYEQETPAESDRLRIFNNVRRYLERYCGDSTVRMLFVEEPTPKGDQND
jgi:hypothetical protein